MFMRIDKVSSLIPKIQGLQIRGTSPQINKATDPQIPKSLRPSDS